MRSSPDSGRELISIVGGGPSVGRVDPNKIPGLVIGVNSAIEYARCDIVVSMDRLWVEHNWELLRTSRLRSYLRRSALKNCRGSWEGLTSFECDYNTEKFSDDSSQLNGFNSGFCALNLAYQLRPKRIYLFGFDMKRREGKVYWYPPYSWRPHGATTSGSYKRWAERFNKAASQFKAVGIEVVNGCSDSAITAFKRVDPRTLI